LELKKLKGSSGREFISGARARVPRVGGGGFYFLAKGLPRKISFSLPGATNSKSDFYFSKIIANF